MRYEIRGESFYIMFKRENYIHVPGFAIVDLQLSGNELLCYSLIYGFSQDEQTEFKGSLSYVASALNVTKQNAKRIIDRLVEKELVEKREMIFSGVKFCSYVALNVPAYQNSNGVAETTDFNQNDDVVLSKKQRGVAESATNNTRDDNINTPRPITLTPNIITNTLKEKENTKEKEKVTRPRRTSEDLCLFENSRYYDYELFEAEFKQSEFDNVDISYYYHAVADWSSQKGKKMKDWIATARNFMRSDREKGKLHEKPVLGTLTDKQKAQKELLEYLEHRRMMGYEDLDFNELSKVGINL